MAGPGGLSGLATRAADPGPALAAIGAYLVGKTQSAFREQGRAGVEWPPRGTPNIIGVLADLRGGGRPKDRRWDARPAGVDTGRLRGSIAWRRVGPYAVEVGSALPYASDVQRGSEKIVATDSDLAAKLRGWIKSLRGERRDKAQRVAGKLAGPRGGSRTITVRPRPFLIVTPQDRVKIAKMLRAYVLTGSAGG